MRHIRWIAGVIATIILPQCLASPARAQGLFGGRREGNPWITKGNGPGILDWTGFGYGAYSPRGYGYYTPLALPGMEMGLGPSPYYGPEWGALYGAPKEDRERLNAAFDAPVRPAARPRESAQSRAEPRSRNGLFARALRRRRGS